MWLDLLVVDADGHVMEPGTLWHDYVDPEFRERCLRLVRDAEDGDKLLINGKPSTLIRRLGGVRAAPGDEVADWNNLPRPEGGYLSYQDSVTRPSWSGEARLRWLDEHDIDQTFLFPSLGLIWPREVGPDSPYARAHYAAYNRWIVEYAMADNTRLIPVAQFALDPDRRPEEQISALRSDGFKHVMFPSGAALGPDLEPLWGALDANEMCVHLHKVAIPHGLPTPSLTSLQAPSMTSFFNHVNETLPGQLFLAGLLGSGVCDRFPELRFVFHECNAGWLPAWLDRATESWETLGSRSGLAEPPSHYLLERDTLYFSVGLGERLQQFPSELFERLLLATDYPHPGTPGEPRSAWLGALQGAPTALIENLLGANAQRMMRSEVSA